MKIKPDHEVTLRGWETVLIKTEHVPPLMIHFDDTLICYRVQVGTVTEQYQRGWADPIDIPVAPEYSGPADTEAERLRLQIEDLEADLSIAREQASANPLAPFIAAWQDFEATEAEDDYERIVEAWRAYQREVMP